MKTKKRLQMLAAVVLMLTMVCGSLPAVYADGASTEEEVLSYQASAYYVDSEYTNPKGPWEWDYYDMQTQEYKPLGILNTDSSSARGYSIVGGYNAVTAIDADEMYGDWRGSTSSGNTNNGTGESEWVKPDGSSYAGAWQQYYPVRSFTAPKTGNVTITAANNAITYSGTASSSTSKVSFRIMQDRDGVLTKVWPVDKNVEEAGPGNPISFSALSLDVQEGDILRFEMYTPDEATNGSNFIRAKWDPIVSYTPLVTEYQASTEFVANTSANPTANWTWNTYVYGNDTLTWSSTNYAPGTYTAITKQKAEGDQSFKDTDHYPIPTGDSDIGELLAISGDGLGIGKYWMRSFKINTTNGKTGYVGLMSTVRTFTANKAGEVSISAVDRNGNSKIESAHFEEANISDEKNKRGVRVLKESNGEITQLWPLADTSVTTGEANGATFALVPANGTIEFPTLTADLKTGDKLHFELANVDPNPVDGTTKDTTLYGCAVYWDPVVSYSTGITAKAEDVTFENTSDDLTGFENIVGSTEAVTATIPVAAGYTESDITLVPIVAIYNQDGTLAFCKIGDTDTISPNTSKNLTVNLGALSENNITDGYIKVFIWDLTNLTPLSDIGIEPVVGEVSGTSTAAYIGTGEAG